MKKIVLTGGGTAGHVTPNIALIPTLQEKGYEVHYIGSYTGIEKKLLEDMDIPQDNPHHTLSVLNHCTKACDIFDRVFVTTKGFQPPYYVRDAVTFHDIGKPYCKTFVNKKGETTEVAHFYDHEHVGAYFVLGMFPGLSESKTIFASWLVCNHMSPFINQKYYNSLPSYLKEWITLLHEADKLAH